MNIEAYKNHIIKKLIDIQDRSILKKNRCNLGWGCYSGSNY